MRPTANLSSRIQAIFDNDRASSREIDLRKNGDHLEYVVRGVHPITEDNIEILEQAARDLAAQSKHGTYVDVADLFIERVRENANVA